MKDDYTPKIIENRDSSVYATFVIQLKKCATCQTPMLPKISRDIFPKWQRVDALAQIERAGWQAESTSLDKRGNPICGRCATLGKASFVCAMCHQERSSDQVQLSFGDPAEHLCKTCYATKPAQEWDQRIEALEEAHRYDFE